MSWTKKALQRASSTEIKLMKSPFKYLFVNSVRAFLCRAAKMEQGTDFVVSSAGWALRLSPDEKKELRDVTLAIERRRGVAVCQPKQNDENRKLGRKLHRAICRLGLEFIMTERRKRAAFHDMRHVANTLCELPTSLLFQDELRQVMLSSQAHKDPTQTFFWFLQHLSQFDESSEEDRLCLDAFVQLLINRGFDPNTPQTFGMPINVGIAPWEFLWHARRGEHSSHALLGAMVRNPAFCPRAVDVASSYKSLFGPGFPTKLAIEIIERCDSNQLGVCFSSGIFDMQRNDVTPSHEPSIFGLMVRKSTDGFFHGINLLAVCQFNVFHSDSVTEFRLPEIKQAVETHDMFRLCTIETMKTSPIDTFPLPLQQLIREYFFAGTITKDVRWSDLRPQRDMNGRILDDLDFPVLSIIWGYYLLEDKSTVDPAVAFVDAVQSRLVFLRFWTFFARDQEEEEEEEEEENEENEENEEDEEDDDGEDGEENNAQATEEKQNGAKSA